MAKRHHQLIVLILAVFFAAGYANAASPAAPDGDANPVIGTVVQFTAGSTPVDVTIDQDNPAVRDFLSMLRSP